MEISPYTAPLPYSSANSPANGAGQRPARSPQEIAGTTAPQRNTPSNLQNTDKARQSTAPRPAEQPGNGERTRREFDDRPNTNAQSHVSERNTMEAIELRPLIVEANNNPATRAFLDVARPARSDFQIIDIYV